MKFKFEVFARIERPVQQVYQAVQQPQHLQKYFTTKRASAPLTKSTIVIWDFADYPGEFPIKVLEATDNKLIVFEWKAMDGDYITTTQNHPPAATNHYHQGEPDRGGVGEGGGAGALNATASGWGRFFGLKNPKGRVVTAWGGGLKISKKRKDLSLT